MGSTRTNEIVSRPKNRKRWTANAAALPSTSAMSRRPEAALTDVRSAAANVAVLPGDAEPVHREAPGGQLCARCR